MKQKIFADLQVHTIFSYDSCNRFDWIIKRCQKVGINCLAVTDHNRIEGAFAMEKKAPFRVIVGEEINTGEGEIIGLFLKEWIKPGKGIVETIFEIKKQSGLVYIPHPLSISRDEHLNVDILLKVIEKIDIIEVFNSRTRFEEKNGRWVKDLLAKGRIVKGAGSDAHSPYEIGNVLIKMEEFSTKEEFLESLGKAHFYLKKSSVFKRLIFNHKVRKILRKFL